MQLRRAFGEKEKSNRTYSRKSFETIIPKIKDYIKRFNAYPVPFIRITDAIIFGSFAEGSERCRDLDVAFVIEKKKRVRENVWCCGSILSIHEDMGNISARIDPYFTDDPDYFVKAKMSHISISSWD